MSVIQFPPRGPFSVHVETEGPAWLVICRAHGWLFGSRAEALAEARAIATGFGIAVVIGGAS